VVSRRPLITWWWWCISSVIFFFPKNEIKVGLALVVVCGSHHKKTVRTMNFLLYSKKKRGNEQTPEVPEAPEGTQARSSGYNFVIVCCHRLLEKKEKK
jgi:hypothetical protein